MVLEIDILYVALAFHTVVWAIGLKAVDILKDGGSIKSMFQNRIAPSINSDKIADEDHDVTVDREAVEAYMENI